MQMKNKHLQGFTLIELLAGIVILSVLVLFLTRVFTDSTNMWTKGTSRVESNLSGRAAVEFMSRELAGAIFEGNLNAYETNHLNMFMDRQAIAAWAEHLDLCVEAILSGHEPQVEESVGKRNSLGQSVSVLAKNE